MPRLKLNHPQTGYDPEGSYFLTADFFLSFANPTVLMILDIVRKKEMTSPAISKRLGITSKIVLDKLKAMERDGILVSYVKSKGTFYRIANSAIAKTFEQILEFPERKLKEAGRSIRSVRTQEQIEAEFPKAGSAK